MTTAIADVGVGPLLRSWRQRRRLSQLELALEAGVSARHVSFVETGRSKPSPDMVLQLAELLEPPVNVLRLGLHPGGLAPRIVNFGEWRAHLLDRLHRQVVLTGDPALTSLYDELAAYPGPVHDAGASHGPGIVVPLRLRAGERELAFFSTVATFGTAIDITVAELSIESFFPADAQTAEAVRAFVVALPAE